MNLTTYLKFLFFDRKAIEKISQCRGAIWFGIGMTLLAAIARDYDAVYLLAQPYHLLVPLAASGLMATVTFLFLRCFPCAGKRIPYTTFLTYFWLTAPLAFIYAFPVERFFSPVGAAKANLWMLALVAAWRVLLLTRVVSVQESASFAVTFFKVLFIANTVVMIVLFFTPIPIFNVMGGIHLSDRDRLILDVVFSTGLIGAPLWIVLLIVNIYLLGSKGWYGEKSTPFNSTCDLFVARAVWVAMGILMIGGVGMMIWAQPEQANRFRVERLLKSGKIAEGLRLMSQKEQEDFPPHWSPPPSLAYREKVPDPIELATEAIKPGYASWVQQLAIEKFSEYINDGFFDGWESLGKKEFHDALLILESKTFKDQDAIESSHEELSRLAANENGNIEPWRVTLATEYLQRNTPLPGKADLKKETEESKGEERDTFNNDP